MRADELLKGAIDLHIHSSPDTKTRLMTDFEIAKQAKKAGMKAFVIKSHDTPTSGRAYLARKIVLGIEIFGGVCLNRAVGGINVHAVKAAVNIGGEGLTKIVWMPTQDAENHFRARGIVGEGLRVLKEGRLTSDVLEVIDVVARHKVILATGHLSVEETKALVKEAVTRGVECVLVSHPMSKLISMSVKDQTEVAEAGAYLEYCYLSLVKRDYSPASIVHAIKKVGPQHCILTTDLGQPYNPPPVDGMRAFLSTMLSHGVCESDIDLMVKENPSMLLGLK